MSASSVQESETQGPEDDLIPKKNSTSCVWEYFGFRKTDICQKQVLCKTCRALVLTSRGNTTNLYQHLKKHHRHLYDECMSKRPSHQPAQFPNMTTKQTSVTEAFESVTPYEKSSRRHREITDSIAKYLAKDIETTSYFPLDHTGENIANGLKDALASWGLNEEGQVCITTDNASNMIKAAEMTEWTRLQCFGHRLHLAIENALKDDRVDRAVGVCKKLVGRFSASWKKKTALTAAQKDFNLPEHSLITECSTRWGTKEKMIERVLEQIKALNHVLSADRKTRHLLLTWQDTDVLESIHKALHPLQEFTDALSGEEYVSISYLKPVLHLLKTKTLAEDPEDTDLTKSVKSRIIGYLQEKYNDPATQELLDVASFLDPRFKTSYISQENIPAIKARMKTEMEEEARKVDRWRRDRVTEPQSSVASSEKPKRSLGSYFKGTATSPDLSVQLDAMETEMNSYLMTPTIDGEEDPLAWWKLNQVNFPRLSRLVRKYLCVPATSSPSERLFSTGGNIVNCQRSCLKPHKVDMLVFLARNL
ncbi:E3 SUMO-protein ligase ZBED1 [Hoplias malabaricus]|uniref:E3 SUMO-protein ligase ZBED1 n=1 Tax=Hoplias malabaricus TaxID=27720 RepID=UPI003462781C